MATRKVERLDTVAALKIGDCFMRITLDTRHASEDAKRRYPATVTFYIKDDKITIYKRLPYEFTKEEFHELCKTTGRSRSAADAKAGMLEEFNGLAERLRDESRRGPITKETVLSLLGRKNTGSFTDLWEEFNATKSVGTRMSYENARKSFIKIVGPITRSYITKDDIIKWEKGMEGLTRTTVGIYERACHAAWNEAVRRGMASPNNNPFGKIPKGASRKHDWLDTGKMTELYQIFTHKRYPAEWTQRTVDAVHRSVGMFLFQYLANGCNMADVAQIAFGEDYFRSEARMLTFVRKKTEDRTGTEVVIPITPALKTIMDSLAAPPERGRLLFPEILKGTTVPEKVKARVLQEIKIINKGMKAISEYLQWPFNPTCGWARHSFATNLTHSGVPERYISEAMGHAVDNITSRYIDSYPIEQQIRYNTRLLDLGEPDSSDVGTITISKEEYELLLKMAREHAGQKQ